MWPSSRSPDLIHRPSWHIRASSKSHADTATSDRFHLESDRLRLLGMLSTMQKTSLDSFGRASFCPSLAVAASISSCIALAIGCGSGLPPGKVQVTGTITLNGKPLTGPQEGLYTVNFASHTTSHTAASRFDPSDGRFSLIIEPGEYVASVIATDGFDTDDEKTGRTIAAKSLIPAKYSSLNESDALVTVGPRGGTVVVSLSTD